MCIPQPGDCGRPCPNCEPPHSCDLTAGHHSHEHRCPDGITWWDHDRKERS